MEKGYDIYAIPENERRYQWFTEDIQLAAGVMHSGYPIVKHTDDPDEPSRTFYGDWGDKWGYYHELGHNYVESNYKWEGNTEVVNNIVGLLNIARLTDYEWPIPKIEENINKCLSDFLNKPSSPSFSVDDTKCNLLVYSQLVRDFGFDCLHELFSDYKKNEEAGVEFPTLRTEKMNEWVVRYSKTVGYNLIPLFADFWGWPISSKTEKALKSLPGYFPDDVITQDPEAESLVKKILKKYPDAVRKVKKNSCPKFDMWYIK